MKREKTISKKFSLFAVAFLVIAALFCGAIGNLGVAVSARADEGEATEEIYYYVDAGNLESSQNAGQQYPGRQDDPHVGTPWAHSTVFMEKYELAFGNGTTGLYNSVLDQQYGEDATTHKSWGFTTDDGSYSWAQWRVASTPSNNGTYDGYKTTRYINEGNKHEGVLTYKFQVSDATTSLKVTVGARAISGWGNSTYPIAVNGTEREVTAKEGDDSMKEAFVTTGVEGTDTEAGKYFVTVTIGGEDTTASSYVNWIMITTENYELPVVYELPLFVEKGVTEVTAVPTEGEGSNQMGTLDAASIEAIENAEIFDEVSLSATVSGKTVTGTATVIPKGTKYFVNVGSETTEGVLLKDGAYSETTHYGYVGDEPGSTGWETEKFYASMRHTVSEATYKFDVENGIYNVMVGITYYAGWGGDRSAKIQANGGKEVPVAAPTVSLGEGHGICVGEVTDGTLSVTAKKAANDDIMLTYFLVYLHEHAITHVDATAATCEDAGTIAHYTCEGCGQNYEDEQGNTALDSIEDPDAPALEHDYDYAHGTWSWNGDFTVATYTVKCTHNEQHTVAYTASGSAITSEVTTPATTTAPGEKTYTATVTAGDGQTYTGTTTEALPPITPDPDAGSDTPAAPAKKKGCGSAVATDATVIAVLLLAAASVCFVLRKKASKN